MKSKDVAIWGHTPPPYGGMTVHISRLLPRLESSDITYQMYNFTDKIKENKEIIDFSHRKLLWLFYLFTGKTEKIHYIITTRPSIRFIAVLSGLMRNRNTIIRVGGASLHKGIVSGSPLNRLFSRFVLRYASAVVGVNRDICNFAIRYGADESRVFHIPGFIPPSNNGTQAPSIVVEFLAAKKPKLVTSAFLSISDKNDIYGMFDLLKALKSLVAVYPDTGVVIYVQNKEEGLKSVLEYYNKVIKENGLIQNVQLYSGQSELWPVFKHCDIYIRPSKSDGDANSIREAIWTGIPVVASDCVSRPKPTLTFPTGNADALYLVLLDCIDNYEDYRRKTENFTVEDNSDKLIALINSFLAEGFNSKC